MRAIQTEWRGYNFRSRLEARYAVLFEDAGLEWRYEVQGFELNDGRRYLPDFYLPDLDLYVEIKGVEPDPEVERLLRDFTRPIILMVGLPDFGSRLFDGIRGKLFTYSTSEIGRMPFIADAELSRCRECEEWVVCVHPESDALHEGECELIHQRSQWQTWGPHCEHGFEKDWQVHSHHELEQAAKAAKSARFEHGDSPLSG